MKKTRILSVLLAICIVSAAVGVAIVTEQPEGESEGIVITISLAVLLATIITAAVVSFSAGYYLGSMTDPLTQYAQSVESSAVATSILTGTTYYSNALANYSQIWQLTSEHWTRQAELTSSFLWGESKDYDPNTMMSVSGVYHNSSYMMINAAAQINAHFDSISERMNNWNQTTTYADSMALQWVYGNQSMSSKTSFAGDLGVAVTVTSESKDRVYLSDGDLWASSSAIIKSLDGTSVTLSSGWNDLKNTTGFSPGVYELQAGSYLSPGMLPIAGTQAAVPTAGLLMTAGSTTKLATWDGVSSKVLVDGQSFNSLSIRVVPDDGTASIADITALLSDYYDLILTVDETMMESSKAATTVWNIYDHAGSASSYITTLTVPNNYDNVNISQSQQEIITILAMEQLADYWTANGGAIKTGDYQMSNESLTLFCRGDIKDSSGNTIYGNVIFTPFFYTKNVTLSNGSNTIDQSSTIAIWESTAPNLSGWDGSVDINDTSLVTIQPGWQIYVYEMEHDGATVSSILLEMTDISIIEPGAIDSTPTQEPPAGIDNVSWIQLALVIMGVLGLAAGLVTRRIDLIVIGSVCIGAGIFIAPIIVGWL
jgi:hypothetical protein